MNAKIESARAAGIRIGELIWPRSFLGIRSEDQERQCRELVDAADVGVILDCTLVEVGNSQIINLLMRIRNHAKKNNKHVVLFHAPPTLIKVINICRLSSILPSTDDAETAETLICDKASGGE